MNDLITSVGGSVHLPGSDTTCNSAAERRTTLLVKCRNTNEVRLAVRAARLRNFPLAVRGAGHDWVGRSSNHDRMVIDLSAMRRVTVDPITRIATVEGGATAADVINAARPYGLVAVTGNVGAVDIAGQTLGGGYGPLTPKFGLALDNLVNAEVVLDDGSLVTVIAQLFALGNPLFSNVGMMSYADMLARFDVCAVNGRSYAVQTRWLADMSCESVTALLAAGNTRPSATSGIYVQHFHGAGTRIATSSSAFGLRRRHFLIEIVGSWDPDTGDDGAAYRQWARGLSSSLAPSAIPGRYANLLAADAFEQIDAAYGCNALRLRRLKRRFDPDGAFSGRNSPLPLNQGS